jgi:hypothetical protein
MWAWAIGVTALAAVVHGVAIALCRRAQAATEPERRESGSPLNSHTQSRIRRLVPP